MGIAISQVLASFEPCFYAQSIVMMALRRLTEKIPLVMNLIEKYGSCTHFSTGVPILPPPTLLANKSIFVANRRRHQVHFIE